MDTIVENRELNLRFENLKKNIPQNEWKYYHFTGIENFIYHLKSFKGERTTERMILEINNYLDAVYKELDDGAEIHDKSKKLFPLIWELSDTYRYQLGFIKKPSFFVNFFLVACLFLLLKISLPTLQSLLISVFVLSGIMVYGYIKTKTKRVY